VPVRVVRHCIVAFVVDLCIHELVFALAVMLWRCMGVSLLPAAHVHLNVLMCVTVSVQFLYMSLRCACPKVSRPNGTGKSDLLRLCATFYTCARDSHRFALYVLLCVAKRTTRRYR